jgi:hypothetical protein
MLQTRKQSGRHIEKVVRQSSRHICVAGLLAPVSTASRRTKLTIGRNERIVSAAEAQAFSDVDSAYVTMSSSLTLIRPYKQSLCENSQPRTACVSKRTLNGAATVALRGGARERTQRLIFFQTCPAFLTLSGVFSQTLHQAVRVRETISFSYQHGGASLPDFLQAQQDDRTTELSYLNLVGSYLMAAAQVNFAVGLEVIR